MMEMYSKPALDLLSVVMDHIHIYRQNSDMKTHLSKQ